MRECDIHHTRAIKINSPVNLGRKPGLDLCYCLLYTSPSPRDKRQSRMPSSA